MSYSDDTRGYRGPKLAIGGVLVTLLLGFVAKPLIVGLVERVQLSTDTGARSLLLHDPAAGPIMGTLRDHFPADFERIVQSVNVAARKVDTAAIGDAVWPQVRAIVERDRHFLTSAPAPTLAAIRKRELAVLDRLASTNPTICAEFVESGRTDQLLSNETAVLMLGFNRAILEAIAAGRDTPVAARTPTPAVFAAAQRELRDVLAAVTTSPQASEILSGQRTPQQALPEHRCEAGRAVRFALDYMPSASADLLLTAP